MSGEHAIASVFTSKSSRASSRSMAQVLCTFTARLASRNAPLFAAKSGWEPSEVRSVSVDSCAFYWKLCSRAWLINEKCIIRTCFIKHRCLPWGILPCQTRHTCWWTCSVTPFYCIRWWRDGGFDRGDRQIDRCTDGDQTERLDLNTICNLFPAGNRRDPSERSYYPNILAWCLLRHEHAGETRCIC